MTQLGISIAWLVLSPLALVTNIIAIVIVCHYQGQFHGTDVAFLSLFVTMMMEAVAVVPVPAVLGVLDAEEDWRWSQLCSAYVWLVLCVRMSDLLVTLIVNVHWMCILRFTSGQEVYSSSTTVKIFVIIAWAAAVVTGIVPVVGYSFYTYYQEITSKKLVVAEGNSPAQLVTVVRRECHFLPEGLGTSFILLFIFLTLAILVMSLVASSDTLAVFHYMKKTAVHKYKAGRFYLPSSALLDTATNKNSEAEGADTHTTRHRLSKGEESLNRESQAVYSTSSNHQNNGDLTTIHKNGNIPGEGAGHSTSATTSTEDSVSRSLDGDLPTAAEDPATNRHSSNSYGNGASGSVSAERGEGGERRLVRSAATVVVRPSVKSGVAKSNPTTVHARYNELNLSAELCRVVFCFTLLAALINHLPFVVLQFLQLVQEVDRQHAETTVLWLTLVHSLALPHVLWLLSRRYRHAVAYTWKVHVLRDGSAREEDPSACTLQSYTRRVVSPEGGTLKVMARSRGREPITMATYESNIFTPNGNAIRAEGNSLSNPAVRGTWSQETDRNHETEEPFPNISGQGARTEVMTTDLDDGMTIVTNLASHQVTYIYNTPPDQSPNTHGSSECNDNHKLSEDQSNSGEPAEVRKDSGIPSQGQTRREVPSEGRRSSTMSSEGRGNSSASSPATVSPSRSSLGTPTRGSTDINRSASARKVWKEKMMKKHLPAIFINEAFESDELMYEERVGSEVSQLPDVTQVTEVAKTQSTSDEKKSKNPQFHFYMSGNFHHDYLRSDSLPRLESESDGGSFQYDDNDIEGILDREHSMRSQRVTTNMTTFLGNSQESAPVDDAMNYETGHSSTNTHDDVISDGDATVPNSGTWPGSESMTQNEDSKSGSVTRTPGNRKPRRSAAILKHSKRPSLQHQTSVHTDPERSGEDISVEPGADSEHISPDSASVVQNNLTERTFYPTFEPSDRTSEVIPTYDSSGGHKEADENRHKLKQPSNVLTSSNKSIGETVHDDIKAVDTDDVFINIENVTTDATHTDTVGSIDSFVPQGQASVLGILLEDGTEIPAHMAISDNSSTFPDSPNPVQEADEFDHISDLSAGPMSPFNPFNDHEHIANSQTNPFFADFSTNGQSSTGLELAPLTREYQPVSSSADSHSAADDTNFFKDMDNTSFSESHPFRPSPFEVGDDEGPVVAHTDGDRTTPDTAAVRDAEETNSLDSEPSVVLEPYNVDRRPPWMDAEFEDSAPVSPRKRSRNPFRASFDVDDSDALGSSGDFGSSFGSNSEIRNIFSNQTKADSGNPFAFDSFSDKFTDDADSDFPQSSVDSGQLYGVEHNGSTVFQSYPFFDEETDRGFEDALALENVIGPSPYFGHFSRRFESIEEEPEDLTDSPHSAEKESSKMSEPADVSQDSSTHISTAELPETNPFGNMNGNSSLSSSSDPSPVFASTNPFSPHNSPQRSIPFDYGEQPVPTSHAETVLVQSPFYQEPVQQNEDMPASITDTSEEKSNITDTTEEKSNITDTTEEKSNITDTTEEKSNITDTTEEKSNMTDTTEKKSNMTDTSEKKSNMTDTTEEKSNITDTTEEKSNITTSAPAPRIRLTKPIPWKLKDSQPNGNELGSDVPTSRNALVEQNGLGSRTNSKDENSVEFDSSSSRTNNDLLTGSDGDHPISGSHHARKPPVPPRPSKEGKVDIQGDESSADYVDPVFF